MQMEWMNEWINVLMISQSFCCKSNNNDYHNSRNVCTIEIIEFMYLYCQMMKSEKNSTLATVIWITHIDFKKCSNFVHYRKIESSKWNFERLKLNMKTFKNDLFDWIFDDLFFFLNGICCLTFIKVNHA